MRTLRLIAYTLFVMLPVLALAGLAYLALHYRDWCLKHLAWMQATDAWWQECLAWRLK